MDDPVAEEPWGPGQASLLAGVAIFMSLLITGRGNDLLPSPERLVLVLAALVVLAVIAVPRVRPWATLIVILLLCAGGIWLRWISVSHHGGSDVMPFTNEALSVLLGGGNPYDHFYQSSRPPGAPFSYPPVNLLIHLPGYLLGGLDGVWLTEFVAAWVVLVLLARLALQGSHPLAIPMLALYAVLPNLLNLVGDGSNDTSVGAMLVLFVLALVGADREERWRAILAGVLAAAALGTKQTTLPLVLAGTAWLFHANRLQFQRYLVAMLATLFVVSIPFLLMSGPIDYVKALGSFAAYHQDVYGWNIWVLAQQLHWPVASHDDALNLGIALSVVALAIVALLPYRTARTALVAGSVATAVVLFGQRWTSYSYLAQLISVVVLLPLLRPWDWSAPAEDPELPPSGDGPGAGLEDDQNATNPIPIAQTA